MRGLQGASVSEALTFKRLQGESRVAYRDLHGCMGLRAYALPLDSLDRPKGLYCSFQGGPFGSPCSFCGG